MAVVTGANKGIGLEIVHQLAKEGITVVLTARDATRGKEALESLKSQGLHTVNFHPLDVASQESVLALAEWLHKTYGGIDILVNNAGILNLDKDVTFETVKPVLDTNYFGVKNVTKALLPLLRDDTPGGARVIVVASRFGQLKHLKNKDYVKTLSDREHLTEDFVDSFVNHYLKDVVDGSQKEGGWPNWTDWVNSPYGRSVETYSVSKVAVIAYVSALHNTLVTQLGSGKKINVFSCTPGFVATDFTNNRGTKTVEEGADTPVWWWSKDTVAVVTGANKGIGLEIVRQLAKEGITVVLTARDETRGKEALESLKRQELHNVNFHPLDVASQESIRKLAEWLHKTYGGIDILINNAGISSLHKDTTFENVKLVLDTNYFGVKNVTKALLPLLRDNTPGGARVVVVASTGGQLKHLESKDYVKTLSDREHLTEDFVDSFANHYLKDVANGSQKERDWPIWSDWVNSRHGRCAEDYTVSKVAVNAYVSALHNILVAQPGREKKINVFSCCPGHVATDINENTGVKTVEEGADTPVWLALHSPEGGSGKFWKEREVLDF
ncbi:unnamed protein product [Sphagnum jensenii]|uniref:Carbonyl reductase n=1 Tax=Sphagnum jensenii TaxID=128206 RepID=A0ABP0X5B7_9BRYO